LSRKSVFEIVEQGKHGPPSLPTTEQRNQKPSLPTTEQRNQEPSLPTTEQRNQKPSLPTTEQRNQESCRVCAARAQHNIHVGCCKEGTAPTIIPHTICLLHYAYYTTLITPRLLHSGLSSCTVRYDDGLYGTHRTC